MAIVEIDRRDFLTFGFARRRRSSDGQPPRRPQPASITQPESPYGWNRIISRRTFLRIGSGVIGTGVGLFVADKLGLLGFLHPESDKRRMGIKLENLQFNAEEGKKIEKDRTYQSGKVYIQQSTTNYELSLDGRQFTYMIDKCNVNKVPEAFHIIIANRYASFNNQGQLEEKEAEAVPTPDGSIITIFIGLDTLFTNAAKQLDQDFEISPEKRAQAEVNFNVLVLNRIIMRFLCSATMLSDLSRRGALGQGAEQATEKATHIADVFRDEILNGRLTPAIIVSRSSRNII